MNPNLEYVHDGGKNNLLTNPDFLGGLLQCILKPAPSSLDQIPDADKKIDEASKTLDCAGACTGADKGGCLLKCLNKH